MNKKRIYNILIILLFTVGCIFIAKPFYDAYKAKKTQEKNLETIMKMKYNKQETTFTDASNIKRPDLADVSNASLDEKAVIGRLSIPSIGLGLPILNSSTENHLLSGATTIREKQQMGKGNYALAGHNMSKKGVLFSDISELKTNDKIYLYDNENEYEYAVQQITEVSPSTWDVVENHGKDEVTLITCLSVLDNSKRWVVSGDLVYVKKIQ
ncbi:class A sortase [Ectobacillus polymachus]|uniref:class A sortase n=1 Tax=Ectobacillus polymachus TaxID=1508806 RepID=UPI003A859ACC